MSLRRDEAFELQTPVFPASAAFTALAMLAGLSAALAVLQDSLALALLAVTGGFLAPILASIGIDNHVVLFSYYAVLNAGIVAIALGVSFLTLAVPLAFDARWNAASWSLTVAP